MARPGRDTIMRYNTRLTFQMLHPLMRSRIARNISIQYRKFHSNPKMHLALDCMQNLIDSGRVKSFKATWKHSGTKFGNIVPAHDLTINDCHQQAQRRPNRLKCYMRGVTCCLWLPYPGCWFDYPIENRRRDLAKSRGWWWQFVFIASCQCCRPIQISSLRPNCL